MKESTSGETPKPLPVSGIPMADFSTEGYDPHIKQEAPAHRSFVSSLLLVGRLYSILMLVSESQIYKELDDAKIPFVLGTITAGDAKDGNSVQKPLTQVSAGKKHESWSSQFEDPQRNVYRDYRHHVGCSMGGPPGVRTLTHTRTQYRSRVTGRGMGRLLGVVGAMGAGTRDGYGTIYS